MSQDIVIEIIEEVQNVVLQGNVSLTTYIFQWVEPPATRNSPGIPGQMAFADDYLFVCVAPNLWSRTILTKGW